MNRVRWIVKKKNKRRFWAWITDKHASFCTHPWLLRVVLLHNISMSTLRSRYVSETVRLWKIAIAHSIQYALAWACVCVVRPCLRWFRVSGSRQHIDLHKWLPKTEQAYSVLPRGLCALLCFCSQRSVVCLDPFHRLSAIDPFFIMVMYFFLSLSLTLSRALYTSLYLHRSFSLVALLCYLVCTDHSSRSSSVWTMNGMDSNIWSDECRYGVNIFIVIAWAILFSLPDECIFFPRANLTKLDCNLRKNFWCTTVTFCARPFSTLYKRGRYSPIFLSSSSLYIW